jgi:hypothetical protein
MLPLTVLIIAICPKYVRVASVSGEIALVSYIAERACIEEGGMLLNQRIRVLFEGSVSNTSGDVAATII